MKKILIALVFLFSSSAYCGAQVFSKKPKKIKINYSFTFIINGTDSVKCKRTPQSEFHKLGEIDKDLSIYASLMESNLEKCKQNNDGFNAGFLRDAQMYFTNFKKSLENYNIALDLTDYEKELAFYRNVKIEKHEKPEPETPVKTNEKIVVIGNDSMKCVRIIETASLSIVCRQANVV